MRDDRAATWLPERIVERVVIVSDPSRPEPDALSGGAGGATPMPRTGVRTLSVNPLHSMKAATAELETALDGLGADMPASTRRRTALLASELIAQVAGGEGDRAAGPVDLVVSFRPNRVRLETRGPSMPSVNNGSDPRATPALADWGQFLLNRLATRWGITGTDSWTLWAEVDFA